MKSTIAFSCEDSSMLTSSIIHVEINSNSSLSVTISFIPIPWFHFVTIILYIWKVIILKTTMSDCDWSRNGSHKWSENSKLPMCFGWNITDNV